MSYYKVYHKSDIHIYRGYQQFQYLFFELQNYTKKRHGNIDNKNSTKCVPHYTLTSSKTQLFVLKLRSSCYYNNKKSVYLPNSIKTKLDTILFTFEYNPLRCACYSLLFLRSSVTYIYGYIQWVVKLKLKLIIFFPNKQKTEINRLK